MHAPSGRGGASQGQGAAGVIHTREALPKAKLHRLDEGSDRQRERQTHLRAPDVGGGAGIREYRDEQAAESIRVTNEGQGTGAVAVV